MCVSISKVWFIFLVPIQHLYTVLWVASHVTRVSFSRKEAEAEGYKDPHNLVKAAKAKLLGLSSATLQPSLQTLIAWCAISGCWGCVSKSRRRPRPRRRPKQKVWKGRRQKLSERRRQKFMEKQRGEGNLRSRSESMCWIPKVMNNFWKHEYNFRKTSNENVLFVWFCLVCDSSERVCQGVLFSLLFGV